MAAISRSTISPAFRFNSLISGTSTFGSNACVGLWNAPVFGWTPLPLGMTGCTAIGWSTGAILGTCNATGVGAGWTGFCANLFG